MGNGGALYHVYLFHRRIIQIGVVIEKSSWRRRIFVAIMGTTRIRFLSFPFPHDVACMLYMYAMVCNGLVMSFRNATVFPHKVRVSPSPIALACIFDFHSRRWSCCGLRAESCLFCCLSFSFL